IRTARSRRRDSVVHHLRVAIAVPREDAETVFAALFHLPVPAQGLVRGFPTPLILGRGSRFAWRKGRRRNHRRTGRLRTTGCADDSGVLRLARRLSFRRAAVVIDPAPLAFLTLPDGGEAAVMRSIGAKGRARVHRRPAVAR